MTAAARITPDLEAALGSPAPMLAALAAPEPFPAGGAVIAMQVALAGAQLAMLARIVSLKHPDDAGIRTHIAACEAAWRAGLDLVLTDARAFAGWLEARRLPKATDAEQLARTTAIDRAARTSCDVPLEIVRQATALAGPAHMLRLHLKPVMLPDLTIALGAARMAVEGGALLVRTNLEGSKAPWAGELRAELDALLARATALA